MGSVRRLIAAPAYLNNRLERIFDLLAALAGLALSA
jgi:hypothetical protein